MKSGVSKVCVLMLTITHFFLNSQGLIGRKVYMTIHISLRSLLRSPGFSTVRVPEPTWGRISEFFLVPGPSYREKGIYDDSHLASLGASLFYISEFLQGTGREACNEFLLSPGAYIGSVRHYFKSQGLYIGRIVSLNQYSKLKV